MKRAKNRPSSPPEAAKDQQATLDSTSARAAATSDPGRKQQASQSTVRVQLVVAASARNGHSPFAVLRRLCNELSERPELEVRALKFLDSPSEENADEQRVPSADK